MGSFIGERGGPRPLSSYMQVKFNWLGNFHTTAHGGHVPGPCGQISRRVRGASLMAWGPVNTRMGIVVKLPRLSRQVMHVSPPTLTSREQF